MRKKAGYLLDELNKHFVNVGALSDTVSNDPKHIVLYVANQKITTRQHTPFVHLHVRSKALTAPEKEFAAILQKGIALSKRLIQAPPDLTKSYQGAIHLDEAVWYEYKGAERRAGDDQRGGRDRRQMERRRSYKTPMNHVLWNFLQESILDRRQGERRKGERRKRERRGAENDNH